MILRPTFLTPFLLALTVALLTFDAKSAAPNLIVIVADDLGYSDLGCYGGEIATPNLDRLAGEGVRLTRFRNAGMCVVSRASLLTGQWWPRALPHFGITPLLPEKLQDAGYRTALIGKWHLQGHPMDRGFDHFFGFLRGFSDHFEGSRDYRLDREPFEDFGKNYYSSEAFTSRAIKFIETPQPDQSDQPFFLYLSYQAPHNPLQAPREDILKYRGKYLKGWQAIREARFKRQKTLGLVPANVELPAYPKNLPEWGTLTPEQRDLEDLRMAVYAAMVERMDRGIGQLLGALRRSGQADNTMLLFVSDNGTDPFSVVDATMLKRGLLPGDRGSNWQPGTGWAYASVTPWRLYKISQHGGGITTGAIAWWPGEITKRGRLDSSALHMVDVMPTFLEAAGLSGARGAIAGQSFVSLLRGQPWQRQGPLYFQYMDNRAIRSASWTLADVDASGWELFQTEHDPLETTNVASKHPDIVKELSAQWQKWWQKESGEADYQAEATSDSSHYVEQGDRGSGKDYVPTTMPAELSHRHPLPQEEELLFLDNETVKIGIDRAKGASITHLSWQANPGNVVNVSDPGRLIQQSYYAGKRLDRIADGQHQSWNPWPWNPIQGGGVGSWARVTEFKYLDEHTLYGETIPKLWDMPNEEADAVMEQWTGFEPDMPNVIVVKCELNAERDPKDRWGAARSSPQEIPACYFTRNFDIFKSYLGKGEWRNEPQAPGPPWGKAKPPHNAMACFAASGQGIAVFSPSATEPWNFGPHAGGKSHDPQAGPCVHIAPIDRVNLGPQSTYQYRYWLVVGDETQIAKRLDSLLQSYPTDRALLTNP
jgi:arylsulfatase A-like enzyme